MNFKLFGLLGLTIIFSYTRDLDSQIRDKYRPRVRKKQMLKFIFVTNLYVLSFITTVPLQAFAETAI